MTITDRKQQVPKNDSVIKYYEPDVATANDYYPFGMLQPGRKYSSAGSGYRYGFNGKENDNEVKGEGNNQDYGMRIYDPRLGRFLSVDPISTNYPELTPYQFASNRPIDGIDLDGLEYYKSSEAKVAPLVTYDPKIKQITHIGAYIVYANVANGMKMKIHSSLKLSGSWNDDNINVGILVEGRDYESESAPLAPEKLESALGEVNSEVGNDKISWQSLTKEKTM
ncbi:MAG TPA: RHS repeat-associated core domain-containing protein, partial [Candidatus Brocadiaceae bacterium]